MSARYSLGSRDIANVLLNQGPQGWPQAFWRSEINSGSKQVLEFHLQTHESIKRGRTVEFHENIHIRIRTGFTPSKTTEYP